jgi:hypothetical protein
VCGSEGKERNGNFLEGGEGEKLERLLRETRRIYLSVSGLPRVLELGRGLRGDLGLVLDYLVWAENEGNCYIQITSREAIRLKKEGNRLG